MKRFMDIILLCFSILAFFSCGDKKVSVSEGNEKNEKIIYTMGTLFGEQLKSIEPSDKERSILLQGVRDGMGEKPQIDIKKYSGNIRTLFRERGMKMAKKMEEEGAKYMEKFVAEGGLKTESGIGYKILKQGTGKNPQSSDRVKVHYHGTLIDGTVFDSSVERKNPLSFPLSGVIKCWKEGVQMVKVGGKIKLVCPASLAYGSRGAPPKIPGGSTLVFEVELLDIVTGNSPSKKASAKKKKKGRSKGKK